MGWGRCLPKVRHRAGIKEAVEHVAATFKALDFWVAYLSLFICCELLDRIQTPCICMDQWLEQVSLRVPVWASSVNVCMAPHPLILGRTLMFQGL